MEMWFEIAGEADEVHTVTLKQVDSRVLLHCTCSAAQMGSHCSHRTLLIENVEQTMRGCSHRPEFASEYLAGTPVQLALAKVRSLEEIGEKLAVELSAARKILAREMNG
jgi:hypothetical protein